MPSVHRGNQKDVYRKLLKDKLAIEEELKGITTRGFQGNVDWSEKNNNFNLSLPLFCNYNNISAATAEAIIDVAFSLKGCIDKFV